MSSTDTVGYAVRTFTKVETKKYSNEPVSNYSSPESAYKGADAVVDSLHLCRQRYATSMYIHVLHVSLLREQ